MRRTIQQDKELALRAEWLRPRAQRSFGPSTQRDPIGLAGEINQYGYVGGDPVNYSDPFGLCPPADRDVTTCDLRTKLGATWIALDGSGGRGRDVIAGIVAANISVSLVEGAALVSIACSGGTEHGCITRSGTGLSITANAHDGTGALAVTIAHEFAHFLFNHLRDEADVRGRAVDEVQSIQYSRPVCTGLSRNLRTEARAVHGAHMDALATRQQRETRTTQLCQRFAARAGVSASKC